MAVEAGGRFMARFLSLLVFTIAHAAIGCAGVALSVLIAFNMRGPAHPGTLLTYVSGTVGCVLLCPIALPAMCISSALDLPFLMPVVVLLNSYLWGSALCRLWAR